MRVVILGGYGVFGGRLARLLLRDGHEVWVAGRNEAAARRFTARHGGTPLVLDRAGDLAALASLGPDTVVDAAGPFGRYADPAHRLAAFCIDRRINYLDLSDDGAFTADIAALDDAARAAGVFALSGASSVPGLSSAAVQALSDGLDSVDTVETAIVPGNRAPRGRSVVAGILARVGRPMRLWRGGAWREERCWSQPRRYRIGGKRRKAWLIDVPDTTLMPAWSGARAVTFRAGMELAMLNLGVGAMARLHRWGFPAGSPAAVRVAHRIAAFLKPFGSDRGGMVVRVTGDRAGRRVARQWTLDAGSGDGLFVPTIVVRALLRAPGGIAPGARPCLGEVALDAAVAAMSDIDVKTDSAEAAAPYLFQRALGEAWAALPASLRRLHEVGDLEVAAGRAAVARGRGPAARLAGLLFRFPPSREDIPVSVTMTRTPAGEVWVRDFAGRRFRSHLTPAGAGRVRERFGILTFEIDLPAAAGVLPYVVRRGWCLGLPLPRFLLPQVETREYVEDGRFRFDVRLAAPVTGALIVHYRGWLAPDA